MTNDTAYRGYHLRDVPPEDPELTHVGPSTPAGEYLRRAWQPVALASEVGDLPLPLRILGEDLVLFRDKGGRLGLLHRHCCHRGVSLEYGIVLERGISCCYHGWVFDVDGRILDTPAEAADSTIKTRFAQGAYPVKEQAGLIFAWFGPPERKPALPVFDTLGQPGIDAVPFSIDMRCNWLQVYENVEDPVHVLYLHYRSSGNQFHEASGVPQVFEFRETPLGMTNVQTRHVTSPGDSSGNGHLWTRTTECILPNATQTGAIWEAARERKSFQRAGITRWIVPIDNTHTRVIGWRWFGEGLDPDGNGDRNKVGKEKFDVMGQLADRPDEERQRRPGDYEAQVSQRPIAIHALEHLASSDRGVVMLRRLIRQGIRAQAARDPIPRGITDKVGYLSTYCQDTVWPVPAGRAIDDAALLRFGRVVAEEIVASSGQPDHVRRARLAERCRAFFDTADLAAAAAE